MYVGDAKRLTAAGAKKIMATAIARAQEADIAVTVAIVNAGGHLVLLERMEGGRFHTVHSATTKAVCAASTRRATGAKGAQGQALDVAHALGLSLAAGAERWTAMEGGCPIMTGNECIGAVGVAGGDWQFDERVAREAAESIKRRGRCVSPVWAWAGGPMCSPMQCSARVSSPTLRATRARTRTGRTSPPNPPVAA